MKLTQLCLGSGLEGVHPAVSLHSGTACLSGSLSVHPCTEFSLEGACFFSPPWSHDGLELEAQAESGGGTQSDASISEAMCMFANYTPTTFTLSQLLGSSRLPRVRLWYGFTLSLLIER